LLIAVKKEHSNEFITFAKTFDFNLQPLGELIKADKSKTTLIDIV